MATVGVYLRVDEDRIDEVRVGLAAIEGAEPFDLEGAGKLGVLLETDDLDAGHDLLVRHVQQVPGVLAAWPVYAAFGDATDESEEEEDGNDAS